MSDVPRMTPHQRVYLAGHTGLVGSALKRRLERGGYGNLIVRTQQDVDLRQQAHVEGLFAQERPEVVLLAAARVGGIHANQAQGGEFIRDNLLIQSHVLDAAQRHGVQRLLFLGSSCIYPRLCPQPMREEHLLTGPLEPTNAPYAVAKIAGIATCQAYNGQFGTRYLPVMPTNLYGPHDNFDPESGHVLPALIRRFVEARMHSYPSVTIWGTGRPRREFLHADDLADALVFLMQETDHTELVNIGTGDDLSIAELADLIRSTVGYRGELRFDHSRPDGTPQKRLDVTKLTSLGWRARITLEDGVAQTCAWFENHYAQSLQQTA